MLGQRLRCAREARNWSRTEAVTHLLQLAERANTGLELAVDEMMLGRWERGNRTPARIYRNLLAQLYDIPIALLRVPRRGGNPGANDPDAHMIGDMRRRAFIAGLAATAIGGATWSEIVEPGLRMEAGMLPGLETWTQLLSGQRESMPLSVLQPAVVDHLGRLRQLLGDSMPAGVRIQLQSIASQTAILVGRNAFNGGNPGHSIDAWGMAAELARAADDTATHARVMALQSTLVSPVHLRAREGETGPALSVLEGAWDLAKRSGQPQAMVGVLGLQAELLAIHGEAPAARAAMDRARILIERNGPFMESTASPRSILELDAVQGNVLYLLGEHREAVPLLSHVFDSMIQIGWSAWASTVAVSRARAHYGLGELDAACADLTTAAFLAKQQASSYNLAHVHATLAQLPDSDATRRLRERLAG